MKNSLPLCESLGTLANGESLKPRFLFMESQKMRPNHYLPTRPKNKQFRDREHLSQQQGYIYILRRKNGIDATHPLFGSELRALRKVQKDYPYTDYVFISERKAPLTDHTFRKILKRADEVSGLNIKVHPNMLKHATGFKLANESVDTRSIQHYLGHKSIQHTVRYTELAASRFKNFWQD